jgi:hypothetical protein
MPSKKTDETPAARPVRRPARQATTAAPAAGGSGSKRATRSGSGSPPPVGGKPGDVGKTRRTPSKPSAANARQPVPATDARRTVPSEQYADFASRTGVSLVSACILAAETIADGVLSGTIALPERTPTPENRCPFETGRRLLVGESGTDGAFGKIARAGILRELRDELRAFPGLPEQRGRYVSRICSETRRALGAGKAGSNPSGWSGAPPNATALASASVAPKGRTSGRRRAAKATAAPAAPASGARRTPRRPGKSA